VNYLTLKRFTTTTFSLLVLILLTTTMATAAAPRVASQLAQIYPENTRYIIRRNNKVVGVHTLKFSQEGDTLQVDVATRIKITVLKVPVFKFSYTSSERWREERLVQVDARTNRNGDVSEVQLIADAMGDVKLTTEQGTKTVGTLPFSSNHWNANVLNSTRLFNTITGNVSTVAIESLGTEEVRNKKGSVLAKHYRYTGDIEADVWYDDAQRWVQLSFKGDDGSNIVYTASDLSLSGQ